MLNQTNKHYGHHLYMYNKIDKPLIFRITGTAVLLDWLTFVQSVVFGCTSYLWSIIENYYFKNFNVFKKVSIWNIVFFVISRSAVSVGEAACPCVGPSQPVAGSEDHVCNFPGCRGHNCWGNSTTWAEEVQELGEFESCRAGNTGWHISVLRFLFRMEIWLVQALDVD